jgi:prepilin-type N-terminal cleavage/methylation domain-containing protein/prepilin-type processing-associated H-X9-DG protein
MRIELAKSLIVSIKRPVNRYRSNRAFTLVELLVVLAVIGILASLLLPALAKAKYMAQMAICRNNLQQISVAVHVYRTDHSAFPLYGVEDLRSEPPMWWKRLSLPAPQFTQSTLGPSPFMMPRIGGVFACPLNRGQSVSMEYGVGSGQPIGSTAEIRLPSIISYGYNAYGVGWESRPLGVGGRLSDLAHQFGSHLPTSEASVRAPSDLIVVGDEFSRSRNAAWDGHVYVDWGAPFIAPVGRETYRSKTPPKKQEAFLKHRGGAHRAFADGHSELEDMRKTFAATDAQLRRWNIDNEPHRDLLND